jgi:RNA polymerase sigma-32 factor
MTHQFRPPAKARSHGFTAEFLDAETEARLARAWRERGDTRARDRLVLAHRALAWSAAARAGRSGGRPDEDLIQQANLGLLKAADRFEPDMGFRFSTYASWWVRAEIQDYAYADWSLIRLPGASSLRRVFFGLRKAEAQLATEGTAPDQMDAALARHFGVDEDKIALIRERLQGRDLSLNQPMGDEDGAEWQETLPDSRPLPDAAIGDKLAKGALWSILARHMQALAPRDREIVLGTVVADDQKTLADLGEEYRISRERVRQLRERALARLRKSLSDDPQARQLLGDGGLLDEVGARAL